MADVDIILLRHGIAEPRGGGLEEELRPLTPEGRDRTRRICRRAAQIGLQAPLLLTSPLLRAQQTANIAVEEGLAPAHHLAGELAPGGDPMPLIQHWLVRGWEQQPSRLILVGHEPDLGHLACLLIQAPAGAVALKKAGLAMVGWPEAPAATLPLPPGQLSLLLTPKVLLFS